MTEDKRSKGVNRTFQSSLRFLSKILRSNSGFFKKSRIVFIKQITNTSILDGSKDMEVVNWKEKERPLNISALNVNCHDSYTYIFFTIRPFEKPFHGSKIILALLKNVSERIICRNLNQRCKYKDPSSGNVYIIA